MDRRLVFGDDSLWFDFAFSFFKFIPLKFIAISLKKGLYSDRWRRGQISFSIFFTLVYLKMRESVGRIQRDEGRNKLGARRDATALCGSFFFHSQNQSETWGWARLLMTATYRTKNYSSSVQLQTSKSHRSSLNVSIKGGRPFPPRFSGQESLRLADPAPSSEWRSLGVLSEKSPRMLCKCASA